MLLAVTQITTDSFDHRWPSLNNDGDIVYSQQDGFGYWQVMKLNAGASFPVALTSGSENHMYPVIADNDDVLYYRDGGTLGDALDDRVVRQSASGTVSILETSTRNALSGAHRDVLAHSGIASDGTSISGYDFFSGNEVTRRFNVSGVGRLDFDFESAFSSYNYPDVNIGGDLIYAGAGLFNSGDIYKTTTLGTFPGTVVASGSLARINDSADIVSVSGNLDEPGTIQLLEGPSYSTIATIAQGSWADINNRQVIVFESLDASHVCQIYRFDLPDIVAITPTWNLAAGGVDFGFQVADANLPQATTAALYWSADEQFDVLADTFAYDTQIPIQVNTYGPLFVSGDTLATAPLGTQYLLLVVDPNDLIAESNDNSDDLSNNVRALVVPTIAQITGGTAVTPVIVDNGITMKATFVPNYGFTLDTAAHIGGFESFNWIQVVVSDPNPPTDIYGNRPQVPYLDPPKGGWLYYTPDPVTGNLIPDPDPADNLPFYYEEPPFDPAWPNEYLITSHTLIPTELTFSDTPSGGVTPNSGVFVEFTTSLAGVALDGDSHRNGYAKWKELYTVSWKSDYDRWFNNGLGGGGASFRRYRGIFDIPGVGESGGVANIVPDVDVHSFPTAVKALMMLSGAQNVTVPADFGDAPDSYRSLLANDGPFHLPTGPMLGESRDSESDGQPTGSADGDDSNSTDDEDGVTFETSVLASSGTSLSASIVINASGVAKLDAWIDFDGSGVFDDPSERISAVGGTPMQAGDNVFSFIVPAGAVVGTTYARFRLGSDGGLLPTGPSADGEVEDYLVEVLAAPNLPPIAIDDSEHTVTDVPISIAVLGNDTDPDGTLDTTSVTIVSPPTHGTAAVASSSRTLLTSNDDSSPVGNGLGSALSGTVSSLGRIDLSVSGYADFAFNGTHSQSGDYTLFVRLGTSDFSSFDPAVFDFEFDDSLAPGVVNSYTMDGLSSGTPFIAWIDNTTGSGSPDTVLGSFEVTIGGTVTYTPEPGFSGTDTFTYTVQDDTGAVSNEATVTIIVTGVNTAPVLAAIGNQTVNELDTLNFTASASDTDEPANALTFSLIDSPEGASIDPDTGLFTWTPTAVQGPASYSFTVRVTDDGIPALFDEEQITVTVTDIYNRPPVIVSAPVTEASVGVPYRYDVDAVDPDNDSLTYTLTTAPTGMTIDEFTGEITWSGASAAGSIRSARTFGSTGGDYPTVMKADSLGNIVIFGTFQGTVDFDLGPQTFNLTSVGSNDLFIAKYSPELELIWARRVQGSSFDLAYDLAIDPAGNIIAVGYFFGSSDFNPGSGTAIMTSAGGSDGYMLKLDASGSYVWSRKIGGSGNDVVLGTDFDLDGNVYVTGFFSGTVDFDPSANVFSLSSAGEGDHYAAKYDSLGNLVWARSNRGATHGQAIGIAVDSQGSVYLTGDFGGTTDFDPGAGVHSLTSRGGADAFLQKLDRDGNLVWVGQLGTAADQQGKRIATDEFDNVYTVGTFAGTVDFNIGAGTNELTSAGGLDTFILKMTSAGDFLWARQLGGPGDDSITQRMSIAVDAAGSVYTSGAFQGRADFDPGPDTYLLDSRGLYDGYAIKLDSDGNFGWVVTLGGAADSTAAGRLEQLTGVVPGKDQRIYVYGTFVGTASLQPANHVFTATSAGLSDGFLAVFSDDISVTVRVADGRGGVATQSFAINVNDGNQAPVLDPIGNRTINELETLTFTATASDADQPANALTFSLIDAPEGASIDPATGLFTWTPTESQGPASYSFTVHVTDDGIPALFDEEQITVTVDEVNIAPTLGAIGNWAGNEQESLSFTAATSDADQPANVLTFSLIDAPDGASIDPDTGLFTWTPTETQGPATYSFTVRVTDDGSPALFNEEVITVTVDEVNIAPTLDEIGHRTVNEQESLSFTATANDLDQPANALTFSLIDAPEGAAIDSATGLFTWVPTETQGSASYTFTVRVADDGIPALFDEEQITVTVDEVNIAPTLDPIGSQSMNENATLNFTATASDADLPVNTLRFSLIDAPEGASIDPITGLFSWTPNASQGSGNYTLTVCVTDDGVPALFDEEVITVTVFFSPRGHGYWKNHPELWPVNSLTIGGISYSKVDLLVVLTTPARGDAVQILAYQLIAAKLNIANGSDPEFISSTVAQADSLLTGINLLTHQKVNTSSALGIQLVHLAGILDEYNDGL